MLSVVVPVYNEEKNVEELVKRIKAVLTNIEYEIVFVDDSVDNTPQIIENMAMKDEKIKFIHRNNKTGLSSAVIEGFEIAKGDIIAVMDGDLQHPPEILNEMIKALYKGADIVIPSRFIPGGDDGGLNLFRKLISAGARYMAKALLKKVRKFSDPTSGIFMFRREIINNKMLRAIGWKILMEILVIGEYKNPVEIPYKFCDRGFGKSKMSLKIQMDYIVHLFSLINRSKEDKRFYYFCMIGLSGVLVDMSVFILICHIFPKITVKTTSAISASVAIISNYILNSLITWGDKIEYKLKIKNELFNLKFIKYAAVCFTGVLIKFTVLLIIYNFLKFNKYLGNFIGIFCASFFNYYMSKYYVFEFNERKKIKYRRSL
ncbi:glycosyltransferase [Clostridium drakei]|uniref:Glycosyl transferase family 2 n=1 Tax=Clostridium drakei TaxID=332101 RepID=A0A2U8DTY4_9CLOT|nr:glycosyltransferase family 2 protein [Clostridium drakei]AWI06118.1 glycosyl transferase family 2 [Clostridium drakei]